MFETVYPHIWMALPKDIRDHLVTVFDIKKTGISEIRDQELISDGHSIDDLRAITLEKMTAYIGSEESFPRAWELSCAKAKYDLNPPMSLPTDESTAVTQEVETVPVTDAIIETKTTPNVDKTKKSK